jgi:transcriptional regulator with GAF, ATPase, and Fis domain
MERAALENEGEPFAVLERFFQPTSLARKPSESSQLEEQAPESASGRSLIGIERAHILSVLKQCHYKISGPRGTAAILDMHPNTLRSRMQKLGITRDEV